LVQATRTEETEQSSLRVMLSNLVRPHWVTQEGQQKQQGMIAPKPQAVV